jgi:hypothetical protein
MSTVELGGQQMDRLPKFANGAKKIIVSLESQKM